MSWDLQERDSICFKCSKTHRQQEYTDLSDGAQASYGVLNTDRANSCLWGKGWREVLWSRDSRCTWGLRYRELPGMSSKEVCHEPDQL